MTGNTGMVKLCRKLAADPVELTIGTEVMVQNLQTAQQHNGDSGTVQAFLEDKGRYAVKLGSGATIRIKEANLVAVATQSPPTAAASKPRGKKKGKKGRRKTETAAAFSDSLPDASAKDAEASRLARAAELQQMSKSVPAATSYDNRLVCSVCGARGKCLTCQGCGMVHYCGRKCQKKHWKAGHKAECKLMSEGADKALLYSKKAANKRQAGEMEAAEKRYRKAIQAEPGEPSSYLNLGQLLNEMDRHEEALEQFNTGLAKFEEMRKMLGLLQEAQEVAGLARSPSQPEDEQRQVQAALLQGVGTSHFLRASKLTTGWSDDTWTTAQAKDCLRSSIRALEAGLACQTRDKDLSSQITHMLAQAHQRAGETRKAIALYRQLSASPADKCPRDLAAVASWTLGRLLMESDEDDMCGSRDALELALSLDDLAEESSPTRIDKEEVHRILAGQIVRIAMRDPDGIDIDEMQRALTRARNLLGTAVLLGSLTQCCCAQTQKKRCGSIRNRSPRRT